MKISLSYLNIYSNRRNIFKRIFFYFICIKIQGEKREELLSRRILHQFFTPINIHKHNLYLNICIISVLCCEK
jgi:hypothetical protein